MTFIGMSRRVDDEPTLMLYTNAEGVTFVEQIHADGQRLLQTAEGRGTAINDQTTSPAEYAATVHSHRRWLWRVERHAKEYLGWVERCRHSRLSSTAQLDRLNTDAKAEGRGTAMTKHEKNPS